MFHQQSQNNYIKVHLFQLLHLHISVNMAVVKNINSVTIWWWFVIVTLINKIECKYQTNLSFAQVMGARLCICKDRKVFSSKVCKATMRSHLLFWQQAVLSESWKHSNNLRMPFSFIQKSAIYPSWSNVFLFLIEQYFIDRLDSILKLF